MKELKKEEAGWVLALTWLSALEETARDFHGERPLAFCERAYDHATDQFLKTLENEYGITAKNMTSIRDAVEEYIRTGVIGGLFQDSSQFELREVNPNRLEIKVHACPYRKSCESLMHGGLSPKDLTCARIGCFRSAVHLLADIDCSYEVTEFNPEQGCSGYIERR
ncbi:MAG: hypothetical protein GXO75_06250 [Calditrichaeota bacterium]|nr:hypothetical protein [Calditrichota bacterium]